MKAYGRLGVGEWEMEDGGNSRSPTQRPKGSCSKALTPAGMGRRVGRSQRRTRTAPSAYASPRLRAQPVRVATPESLEERVADLEGCVSDHVQAQNEQRKMIQQLSQRVDHLDQKVDRFREELAVRITNLEESVNERINGLEQSVNERSSAVEDRIQAVSDRIGALDEKVSRQFVRLVGIQVTVLVAVVGALLTALLRQRQARGGSVNAGAQYRTLWKYSFFSPVRSRLVD